MGLPKQIAYNTIGTTVSLIAQWAIMLLIPLVTGFFDAGLFAVAVSICSIITMVSTMSIYNYQVADGYREYSENDYHHMRMLTILLSFVIAIAATVILGYRTEQIAVCLAYLVYRNILLYVTLYCASLQVHEGLEYVGKCSAAEGAVSFVSFMIPYCVTGNLALSTALMALCGGGIFAALVIRRYRAIFGRFYPHDKLDKGNLRALLLIGVILLVSTFVPTVINALPKLVLQYDFGEEITGIFSIIAAPTLIIPTVAASIMNPFIPFFADLSSKNDMHRIRREYTKVIGAMAGLGLVLLAVSFIAAGPVFRWIYGDAVSEHIDCFYVLVVGMMFYAIAYCAITVLITKNQKNSASAVSLLILVVGSAVIVFLTNSMEIMGASVGFTVAYAIMAILLSLLVYALPLAEKGHAAGQ